MKCIQGKAAVKFEFKDFYFETSEMNSMQVRTEA